MGVKEFLILSIILIALLFSGCKEKIVTQICSNISFGDSAGDFSGPPGPGEQPKWCELRLDDFIGIMISNDTRKSIWDGEKQRYGSLNFTERDCKFIGASPIEQKGWGYWIWTCYFDCCNQTIESILANEGLSKAEEECNKRGSSCFENLAKVIVGKDVGKAEKLCDKVKSSSCYENLALILVEKNIDKAEELCERAGSSCYENLAMTMVGKNIDRAEKLCDKSKSDPCYENLARAIAIEDIDRAEKLCDKIGGESCYTGIAYLIRGEEDKLERAMSICNKIGAGVPRDRCYLDLNFVGNLLSFKSEEEVMDFCRTKIESPYMKASCFIEIASTSTNPLVCGEIVDSDKKNFCMSFIEINKRVQNN